MMFNINKRSIASMRSQQPTTTSYEFAIYVLIGRLMFVHDSNSVSRMMNP